MNKDIRQLIDSLVPRGGEMPGRIHISLEEYLSRLANLNRKIASLDFRFENWKKLRDEHQVKFEKHLNSKNNLNEFNNTDSKIKTLSYSSRDSRLKNEFEVLLYSVTSTLSNMTRVVASFLKGSTQVHSHSSLASVLSKHSNFFDIHKIVVDACKVWTKELTERRDSATHYIALSATSYIKYSKLESGTIERTFSQIQIPKYPTKYISLWEDELPTLGGSSHSTIVYSDGKEVNKVNELMDLDNVLVVRREQPLEKRPEFIEADDYVNNLHLHFHEYVSDVLSSLVNKLST